MTKKFKNDRGIALVTTLMLTLLSLVIIMATFYLITAGTVQSGANKRYRSALDASYGGSHAVIKDILPQLLQNFTDPNMFNDVANTFASLNLQVETGTLACMQAKLTSATSTWISSGVCGTNSNSLSPTVQPDFQFTLPAANGATPYTVYSKIVDTVPGNTDMSGVQLEGAGVAESQNVIVAQHYPYVYRVEVQAQRLTNATEQANLSILYAY